MYKLLVLLNEDSCIQQKFRFLNDMTKFKLHITVNQYKNNIRTEPESEVNSNELQKALHKEMWLQSIEDKKGADTKQIEIM